MGLFKYLFGARPRKPAIRFDIRCEQIVYRLGGKRTSIGNTSHGGERLYCDSGHEWDDRSPIASEERIRIFNEVFQFVRKKRINPIIVINVDDILAGEWTAFCERHQAEIAGVERTSDRERDESIRSLFLEQQGPNIELFIEDVEFKSEAEYDKAFARLRDRRPNRKR